MATLNFADIQGFLLTSYASNMPCASYLMLKISDAAACRKWLKGIAGSITTGQDRKVDYSLNIAFTSTGLAAFGLTDAELETFSVPFREGMATPLRKQLLGDID